MTTSQSLAFQQYCNSFVTRITEQAANNVEERIAIKKLKEARPYRRYVYNAIELNINYFRQQQLIRDKAYIANGIYRKHNPFDVDNPVNAKWYREMSFRRNYIKNLKRHNLQIKAFDTHDYIPCIRQIQV